MLFILYYSFIHSRLIYGLPIWQSVTNQNKKHIQVLQNKAIKYIKFLPLLTPSSALYNDSFLNLNNLVKFECVLFIYKVKTGLLKSDTTLLTNHQAGMRETRQSNLIRLPPFLTTTSQQSIFYYGVTLFNSFLRYLSARNISIYSLKLSELKSWLKKFSAS